MVTHCWTIHACVLSSNTTKSQFVKVQIRWWFLLQNNNDLQKYDTNNPKGPFRTFSTGYSTRNKTSDWWILALVLEVPLQDLFTLIHMAIFRKFFCVHFVPHFDTRDSLPEPETQRFFALRPWQFLGWQKAQKNGEKLVSFKGSFTPPCQLFRRFRLFPPLLIFIIGLFRNQFHTVQSSSVR